MADQKLQVIIKTVADTTGLTLTTEGAQKLQAALDGASKSTAKTGESQQKLGVSAKGASHELRGMAEAGRGGRVVTTLDTTLVQGDASDLAVTSGQQLVVKPYASSENDWQYATPIASPITNTTAVALKAAGAASIRNFVTSIQYQNTFVSAQGFQSF
jgi:hypothetical protein